MDEELQNANSRNAQLGFDDLCDVSGQLWTLLTFAVK